MSLHDRLIRLAKIGRADTPVVSVYLSTRWADGHQRDRVRIFLKNELAKARRAPSGRAADADLDWVEREGEAVVAQARFPDAHGVALFACQALHLREVFPVSAPFPDNFVVADAPFLRPLAEQLREPPSTLVVVVDTESARLIPLTIEGTGQELVLDLSNLITLAELEQGSAPKPKFGWTSNLRGRAGVADALGQAGSRAGVTSPCDS